MINSSLKSQSDKNETDPESLKKPKDQTQLKKLKGSGFENTNASR